MSTGNGQATYLRPEDERVYAEAVNGTHTAGVSPVLLADLWDQYPNLAEPVIDGLLRRGQVGNLVSTSKAYKTYLVLQLAASMAMKRIWLDRFPCVGGRVLCIDLELQQPDLVHRTREIAKAMHADAGDLASRIEVVSLRGKLGNISVIERHLLSCQPGDYSLIIIDPLYKAYPDPFDENSNAQMTLLYQRFERLAEHLQAAVMIVHHGTKGSQSEKRVVDVGSGASAQSRSADAHIALREHEVEGAIVFDARVRSFAPIEPIILSWQYPLWHRNFELDPTQLKTSGRKTRKDEPDPEPVEVWTPERFAAEFITAEPKSKTLIVELARQAGVQHRAISGLIELGLSTGLIHRWTRPKTNAVHLANRAQTVTETGSNK